MLELVIDVDGTPANILWWMNRSKDDRTREGRP